MTFFIDSKRTAWIDNLRAFAMLAVVFGHVANKFITDNTEINRVIVIFNMPLFVLISGYCANKSFAKITNTDALLDFIIKIGQSIGIPSVSFGAVSLLISSLRYQEGNYQFGLKTFLFSLFLLFAITVICRYLSDIAPISQKKVLRLISLSALSVNVFYPRICVLWFFPMIIKLSIIFAIASYLISRIPHGKGSFLFMSTLLLSYLSSLIFNTHELDFFPFYILGIFLARRTTQSGQNSFNPYRFFISLFTGIFLLYIVIIYKISANFYDYPLVELIASNNYAMIISRMAFSICICLSIFEMFRSINLPYNLFSYSGQLTLGIYPIHGIMLSLLTLGVWKFMIEDKLFLLIGIASFMYVGSAFLFLSFGHYKQSSFMFKGILLK